MIIKPRQKSLKLLKLETLLRRLPQNHPKREKVEEQYRITKAGVRGESSIDYYLNFIPNQMVYILHHLRLSNDNVKFQMDTLLLSPYFFLIIEVKYLSGEVTYDPDIHQLIQIYNGQKRIYSDPTQQVKRQAYQLRKWLISRKLLPQTTSFPIESVVVFANDHAEFRILPSQLIDTKLIYQNFFRSSILPDMINNFFTLHTAPVFSPKQLKKLGKQLTRNHIDDEPNILEQFQIQESEILRGVICPKCNTRPMLRKQGTWKCHNICCAYEAKFEHITALSDYKLLLRDTINNKQMQIFIDLPNSSGCKYLLKSMNLVCEGTTRKRIYHLPSIERLK
ncbi:MULTISPECIES: nuclease-related domain-containing protein [Bacillaceae]|uniref:NERD domain-containing protein n=1 Tax=Evansella alkalicola TaxID=745819 RepID=A0ABS6K106_9BACI|nr:MULTISPECIES: nuclease-related domain-containing protein [Bacillaceae]MBU9724345.1 NERD domain-containing protein [Bacillus alkalicola]